MRFALQAHLGWKGGNICIEGLGRCGSAVLLCGLTSFIPGLSNNEKIMHCEISSDWFLTVHFCLNVSG